MEPGACRDRVEYISPNIESQFMGRVGGCITNKRWTFWIMTKPAKNSTSSILLGQSIMIIDDHVVRTTFSAGREEWPYTVQMIGITRSLNMQTVLRNVTHPSVFLEPTYIVVAIGNVYVFQIFQNSRESFLDAYRVWCMPVDENQ